MTATLFEMPPADLSGAPVAAYRVELEGCLAAALADVEKADPRLFWIDQAADAFLYLAETGDTSVVREDIIAAIDTAEFGAGALLDNMLDHINCIGLAFWRLYRAERGVTGKGGL